MLEVIAAVEVVKMIAKDVHYRSNDMYFYALHLLADKIDFGNAVDDLKEAYYLGQKEELPPQEKEICAKAVEICPDVRSMDNEALVSELYNVCTNGLYEIEQAKREAGLMAGVHAILDGISQNLLTVKGLCWRTLHDEGKDDSDNRVA